MVHVIRQILPVIVLLIIASFSSPALCSPLKPGTKAPEFRLKNLDGKQISLADLLSKGHVMLVFWELECVYCYSHIKEFNALQAEYRKKGFTIAGINFLGEYEEDVQAYARDNNVQYLLLADRLNNIDVAEAYKVIGSPTIVLISPKGTVLSYGYTIPDIGSYLD